MKTKKLKGIHRCWTCKQKRMCTYGPDPYRSDMNGDPRPVWQCDPCKEQRAWDI
jgi:hypothetical protein